jgi:hypothetical protein
MQAMYNVRADEKQEECGERGKWKVEVIGRYSKMTEVGVVDKKTTSV